MRLTIFINFLKEKENHIKNLFYKKRPPQDFIKLTFDCGSFHFLFHAMQSHQVITPLALGIGGCEVKKRWNVISTI